MKTYTRRHRGSSLKTPAEPVAILDLGTNTFHLLIVAPPLQRNFYIPFKILHKEKIAVKIGQGGISQGFISVQAEERMLEALLSFQQTMLHYKVKPHNIAAVATSALRNANNREEIINDIKQKTGIEIAVISGDQEAEYIYYGVKTALKVGKGNSLIMDIGGGSVEFIICDEESILWKQSFEIGAQRLLDKFMQHDPILLHEVENLFTYLDLELEALTLQMSIYQPEVLIGCSGTFDTIDDINLKRKHIQNPDTRKESAFTTAEFKEIFQDLLVSNHAQRLLIPGMLAMRADMIVVACCLLDYILNKYAIGQIRVSHYALKEGVLSKMLGYM